MNKNLLIGILLVLSSGSILSDLKAQIVNIEDKRTKLADTSGIFGFVDLSFNLVSNTKTIINAKGHLRLEWINKQHQILSISAYNLVSVNNDRFINNGFQHLRYNYHIHDWLTWEVFGQIQENEQIRVQLRGLLGTGPRFRLLKQGQQKIYVGTLYMFEYNEISKSKLIQRDHRLSAYLSMNLSPSETLQIANTTYAQPRIGQIDDIRLTSSTTFTLKIANRLSFRSNFSVSYDSKIQEEAEGIPSTIYSWLNGLRWDF